MANILLTGATGFLGGHLLQRFIVDGHNVVALKRKTSNTQRIDHLQFQFQIIDIDDGIDLKVAISELNIDTVVHTACSYGRKGEKIETLLQANIMLGMRIMEAAIQVGVRGFINTDTMLKKHLNPYAQSKAQFREWLEMSQNKLKTVNLKIEQMYGPGDDPTKFFNWLAGRLKRNEEQIDLTTGVQKRDFIYIDDVVDAYSLVIQKFDEFPAYSSMELGTGTSVSVRSFVEALKDGIESKFGKVDTHLNFGAVNYRDGEEMNIQTNPEQLLNLGWIPKVTYEAGIKKLVETV